MTLNSGKLHKRLRFAAETERALAEDAPVADIAGHLTARQLELARNEGWFRMFVPKSSGGLQVPLPDALLIEEALAAIDAGLGWTVTLCSGAGLFAGFVDPALRDTMFSGEAICIGGSGMPSGTAARVPGGYVVNGHWRFATGAPHLTAFSANCRIVEDGVAVMEADGSEVIRSFMFLPSEVQLMNDWSVMGLRATASDSFSVHDLFVPELRSFRIVPEAATSGDIVYQYPFLQFAELTLAANFGGIGLGFIEASRDALKVQAGPSARSSFREERLAHAELALDALLHPFHQTARRSWEFMTRDESLTDEMLAEISFVSRSLAAGVRAIVTDLLPYAGLAAAEPSSRLNRILRDLFTATQHSLLNYPA